MGARQILGQAIEKAPKDKTLRSILKLSFNLVTLISVGSCAKNTWSSRQKNCYAWSMYAELERSF